MRFGYMETTHLSAFSLSAKWLAIRFGSSVFFSAKRHVKLNTFSTSLRPGVATTTSTNSQLRHVRHDSHRVYARRRRRRRRRRRCAVVLLRAAASARAPPVRNQYSSVSVQSRSTSHAAMHLSCCHLRSSEFQSLGCVFWI